MVVMPGQHLAGQMLEFGDTGIIFIHGVVDSAVTLDNVGGKRFKFEIQCAVGQTAEAAAEEFVGRGRNKSRRR